MRRQVIWLMTDTTRWDMLGCYGNPGMVTPNLDRLAAEGLRFDRAFTTQPVCGPARSALFTGMYPHSNGSWANSMPLSAGVKTIGERLTDSGLHCAYIGKWHLDGGDYFGNGVCPPGWDANYWYDMRNYLEELSPEDRVRSRTEETAETGGGIDESFTFGHRCADRAMRYLGEHRDDDFFLVLSLDEPHGPCLCPEPFASMYRDYEWPRTPAYYDRLEGKPETLRIWAGRMLEKDRQEYLADRALYLGCNSYADYELGRVLDKVPELAPDALVLFTSDHGNAMSEHSLTNKGPTIYDSIARIPLIVKGGVAGKVYPRTVSHIDLPATVLDYFDVLQPPSFQGSSLMPVIRDPETEREGRAFVEFHRYEATLDGFGGLQLMRAVVTDRYKLGLYLTDSDEFYDLDSDPFECENQIDNPACSAERDRLHDVLLGWMNDTCDPFRGYQWRNRPWREDARPHRWSVDGFTRQPENEAGQQRQLDYDTGLPMEQSVRTK